MRGFLLIAPSTLQVCLPHEGLSMSLVTDRVGGFQKSSSRYCTLIGPILSYLSFSGRFIPSCIVSDIYQMYYS
ncbi:hypothetical protein RSAG8_12557, partial [Rhizoctonia solani AG-8 WAC10335]